VNSEHPKKDQKGTSNIKLEERIRLLEKWQFPPYIIKCKAHWVEILSHMPPTAT